eukprot:CAMPEP_0174383826 /NCGR_PEP_ID=MMETSP0811_2-20130205/125507_1 /TAXON_ID=73025 ORGANISM="Eutreptiella gymnastica-like, Strain CCMP1594" /NCGR_SAMPLE_ID=MMETSP0811_2 /ASSEMBLY_ACC=CAM_ASM_000667 /LENGTH=126 /DNA_ID=CAMNT_0015537575 /DNA_START=766 /DNA_END=1146 /DNA_ORIENTATION=-
MTVPAMVLFIVTVTAMLREVHPSRAPLRNRVRSRLLHHDPFLPARHREIIPGRTQGSSVKGMAPLHYTAVYGIAAHRVHTGCQGAANAISMPRGDAKCTQHAGQRPRCSVATKGCAEGEGQYAIGG